MNIKDLITKINDKSLTTKERGSALETYVLEVLKQYDSSFKATNASGSKHGDGDIIGEKISVDCKVHNICASLSIKATELEKINQQAAITNKVGIIVSPLINNNKLTLYATIKLEDLMELI